MTVPYALSPLARTDLRNIYAYGLEKWGERQADAYFFALHNQFAQIASDPKRFPLVPDFREDCRRCVFRSHAIYFQVRTDEVTILGIIGSQDLDVYRR